MIPILDLKTLNAPYEKELIQASTEVIQSGWFIHGKACQSFEKEFADFCGIEHCIGVANGLDALTLIFSAYRAMGILHDGDEVIVPANTYIASILAISQNNLKPVFVDVLPDTYNIDPQKIEEKITKKTKAIIPVHMYGLPADMEPILRIAKKYKLKIIEDSCETMLARYRGKMVGSIGDVGCFSTYVAHIITTGVGGIVTTNNPDYAIKIKSLINHGRDSIYLNIDDDNNLNRRNSKEVFQMVDRRFSFIDVGYSYRLTEMEAALGLEQLKYLKTNIKKRQKNALYLINSLKKFSNLIQLPTILKDRDHVFLGFPIVIKDKKIKRSKLLTYLEKNGIETRYMMPLLNQPIYKKIFGNIENQYPIAKYINQNGFYIGCHPGLKKDDLDYIFYSFETYFKTL